MVSIQLSDTHIFLNSSPSLPIALSEGSFSFLQLCMEVSITSVQWFGFSKDSSTSLQKLFISLTRLISVVHRFAIYLEVESKCCHIKNKSVKKHFSKTIICCLL